MSAATDATARCDSRRRTILYLERNADGTIGGSYRSLLYLVRLLPKDRWRPVVVFYREHHLLDEFRKAGCRVILRPYPPSVNLVGRAGKLARFWPVRLAVLGLQKAVNLGRGSAVLFFGHLRLLIHERVDLVHLNNGVMCAPELLIASRLLRVRTIVHQRGIGPLPRSARLIRRLIDHVICVSDAARDNLVAHGFSRDMCTTVHNGIDPAEFRASIRRTADEVRRSLRIPCDVAVVGNAGMIRPWKGQIVLVRAFALLPAETRAKARCLIVGGTSDRQTSDAEYLARIHDVIRQNALGEHVQIVGYQPNIAEYMQTFDVMVHTAVDPEPFSRAVLEGMSLGRAMIATRTGGTPEAIEHRVTGLLVEPDDPAELARAITELLGAPAMRAQLGEQAQARIESEFAIQTNVDQTRRVYASVFGDAVPTPSLYPCTHPK